MTSAFYFKKDHNYNGSLCPPIKRYKHWREDAASRDCPGSLVYLPSCTGHHII